MARMQTTPRFPLGTRVLKRFPGYGDPFSGEIDAFLAESGFYHVRYDDGDSEEMTEDDVNRHYHGEPRKREKRPKSEVAETKTASLTATLLPMSKERKKKPRTKMLLLSTTQPAKTMLHTEKNKEDDNGGEAGGLADDEEDEEEEEEEEEEEVEDEEMEEAQELMTVTTADTIHKLVGQRVCKRQADGEDGVVSGTVSTYFPATKMYRVVYANGTTDDMTYREVVDSVPLSATATGGSAAAKTNKRKLLGESSPPNPPTTPTGNSNGGWGAGSHSPKKRKMDEKHKSKLGVTANENIVSENTVDTGDDQVKRSLSESIMVMPKITEKDFVWNRSAAYDIVRAVLYVMTSTTNEPSESLKALEQKGVKAKAALKTFVDRGGLATLKDRLVLWCKEKETEAGVLAILKVLAVLPGVTTKTVSTSEIGKALNDIRKRREGCVSPLFDPIVRDMASYVISKWKKEFGEKSDNANQRTPKALSKLANETKSKPSLANNNAVSKPVKASSTKAESPSNGGTSAALKRSNSAGHLRDLIGGSRGNQARSSDSLGNRRPGSRPLGSPHARSARRSTVLLDSIKQRLKSAESERSSPTTGDRNTLSPEVWTASRVKFGGHSTLEFDKEIEVALLLIAPTPGAIRPFKSKHVKPPTDKQPAKSILRVKLAASERAANKAAVLEADESRNVLAAAAERMSIGGGRFTDISSSGVPTRPSIGDDNQDMSGGIEAAGDREEEGEVSLTVAPPSPPRRHESDDEEDAGVEDENDLPPMPNDIMIGAVPSPPSSETANEPSVVSFESTTGADVDMDGGVPEQEDSAATTPFTAERTASPEVSSDSSSAESGEEDETSPHPLPHTVSPPPPPSEMVLELGGSMEVDP